MQEGDGAGGSAGGWSAWRVSGEHLPLVVGGVAGGALIVMLVVAAVVWRLCVLRRDKQYREYGEGVEGRGGGPGNGKIRGGGQSSFDPRPEMKPSSTLPGVG